MTGKWKLFKCDILCMALPAAFPANWAMHLVPTQVSPCNLGSKTPVLRPTAEVCSCLYTEAWSTLLVVVSFPTDHSSCLFLCFFQQFTNNISFPLQICCSTKTKPWLPQIALLIYHVILCHAVLLPLRQAPPRVQHCAPVFRWRREVPQAEQGSLHWFLYFLSRCSQKSFQAGGRVGLCVCSLLTIYLFATSQLTQDDHCRYWLHSVQINMLKSF